MKKIIKLTESDLHNIVKESVNKILNEGWVRGYTPNDGNYMVGGEYGSCEFYGSTDVMEEFLERVFENTTEDEVSEEEWKKLRDYCEQNPNVFIIEAVFISSYDESTGYGTANSPFTNLESTSGEKEALEYVAKYPNQRVAQVAVQILKSILDKLEEDDFEIEEDYD